MCKTKECGYCGELFKVISGRKDFCSKRCYGISKRSINYDKGSRVCNSCLKEKRIDKFHKGGKYKDGSISYVRNCKRCEIHKTYNKYNVPGLPVPTPTLPFDYDYRAKKIASLRKRFKEAKYKHDNNGKVCCIECNSMFSSNLESHKIEAYCAKCRRPSEGMDARHEEYDSIPNCIHCKKPYYREYGSMTIRCTGCAASIDRASKSANKAKRRIAKSGSLCARIDPIKVFKRDKWRCKMCSVKTQKRDIYANDAAELDHVIPISKGGKHIPSNLQCLCRQCNAIKSDKLVGQASLFSVPLSGR